MIALTYNLYPSAILSILPHIPNMANCPEAALLTLPRELRDNIYAYVFQGLHQNVAVCKRTLPGLLLACRQTSSGASAIFHGLAIFYFKIEESDGEGYYMHVPENHKRDYKLIKVPLHLDGQMDLPGMGEEGERRARRLVDFVRRTGNQADPAMLLVDFDDPFLHKIVVKRE